VSSRRYPIASPSRGAPLIAADVGGTHARIASIRPLAEDGGAAFVIDDYCKYACADYPGLGAIIDAFRVRHGRAIDAVALAIAGFVVDDAVINVNLPWAVSISALRRELGLRELAVVNDFKAIAHAVGHIAEGESTLLCGPSARQDGPVLVVGPGTGLGGAVHLPRRGGSPTILATEVGQATLAATTEIEFAVLGELRRRSPRVLVEHVLSGTGLVNLDAAIRALRGAPALVRTAAGISAAARGGGDPLASETVDVFCAWFGALLGDLALLYGAQGGIYLAGGVLPQMRDLLARSRFVERFLDKGAMREALERTPVRLVDHAQLGVIGAASWYFEREPEYDRAPGADASAGSGG